MKTVTDPPPEEKFKLVIAINVSSVDKKGKCTSYGWR